jgi:hypothetical protein
VQLADYLPMFIGAFGGSKEEVEGFVSALGAMSGSELKGLGVPVGQFDLTMDSADECRINVNCGGGSDATKQLTELMLVSLFAPREYDRLFEAPDGDGQVTDRTMLVRAIIDWADRDTAQYGSNGAPEDYGYEARKSPYKARDNYYDTIDEIQLVRGMDERRWAVFGSAFTVYGSCRVNVSACDRLEVIRSVIVASAKDPQDPLLSDLPALNQLAMAALQARQAGMFDDLKAFKDFIKSPELSSDSGGASGGQSTSTQAPTKLPGIELDETKLQRVARAGPRRMYRMKATAVVRKVTKTTVGVWDAETTNQNSASSAEGRGAWVYWRED